MSSWTIHLPPPKAGNVSDAERFLVLKDGLRPFAILFGPLWFLAKRYWLGALGALIAEALILALVWRLDLPRPFFTLPVSLLHFLFGLEAASIQRWTLTRRGWREVGAVVAHGRNEAELRAASLVAELDLPTAAPAPIKPQATRPMTTQPAVLGLFPEAPTR